MYLRTPMYRFFHILLLITAFIFGSSLCAAEDTKSSHSKKPLKIISVSDNPPFTFQLPNGDIAGYYIEFWKLWSETNNYPVEFEMLEFEASVEAVKNSNAVHSGLFVNDSRKQWADFSMPFHSVETGIIFNQHYTSDTVLSELSDITVAVTEGSFQQGYLEQHYPQIKLHKHYSTRNAITKLLNNDVQAIVGELPFLNSNVSRMGLEGVFFSNEVLIENTVHMVIPKGNTGLLEVINSGIKNIPVEKILQLEKKWLPAYQPYFADKVELDYLSIAQQEWLSTHLSLDIGVDKYWPPLEFINEDGDLSGLFGDYGHYIATELGLRLNVADQYNWSEALNLVTRGELDLLLGVAKTPERAKHLIFTDPIISFSTAIVTRKNSFFADSLTSLNGRTLALVEGYAVYELVLRDYPEINIITVPTMEEGLLRVNKGEMDAFMGVIAVINPYIENNDLDNLVISSFTEYKLDMSMAFRKGLEPLVEIVNQTLARMSDKEKKTITNNWLSVYVNQGWQLATILQWAVPIFLILSGIILFISYSNRRMKAEIAERKNAEQKLIEATELAKHANQAKSDFLANMSHEIRTPMNAVIGMCHLLIDSELSNKQRKNINVILSSSDALLLLINDILDLSKIEAGKLTLEQRDYKLQTVLQQINSQITLLMNNRNVSFHVQVDENVPTFLSGDKLRLGQILLNLCNNAAKFTSKGNIDLRIKLVHLEQKKCRIRIEIEDTGIGMSQEQIDQLFNTYSQADTSITRKYGGTGLGLTITKHLVSLMDGKIWINSEVGKGSTFSLEIDQQIASKNKPDTLTEADTIIASFEGFPELQGKKVLLVDDNKVNLMVTSKLLKKVNMAVSTVENGQQAVDIALQDDFDIVLMDLQMPVMDGYTATTEIRKQSKNEHLPIVALSANVMQADIDRCYQVGINSHLPKPLNINQVYETISRYIGK